LARLKAQVPQWLQVLGLVLVLVLEQVQGQVQPLEQLALG